MHRINPEYFETAPVDRSLAADVSLREEPDEEEDEEQDSNYDESDDEYEGTRSNKVVEMMAYF